jgi:hypothetical protein
MASLVDVESGQKTARPISAPLTRHLEPNDDKFCLAMLNSWSARPRAMTNRHKVWILFVVLAGTIGGIGILLWWGAQPSLRPESMPVGSIWIDAPNVPFSWHHGCWFGCWIDSDGHSDRCRLWGAGLETPIVFEGRYVSCETHSPVAADKLRLKAPPDSMQMWVGVAPEEISAPAAFLQNGKLLVPLGAPHGCEELREKLKHES